MKNDSKQSEDQTVVLLDQSLRATGGFTQVPNSAMKHPALSIDLLLTRSEAKSEDTCWIDLRGAGHFTDARPSVAWQIAQDPEEGRRSTLATGVMLDGYTTSHHLPRPTADRRNEHRWS